MHGLLSLFPSENFSLIAFILAMPLLGAFVNGVFGRRLGKPAVRLMALSAIGASFAGSVLAFISLDSLVSTAKETVDGHVVHKHVKLAWTAWEWMRTSNLDESPVAIDLRFSIDALSGVMMLVVTGVGFLIHVYASSYMEKDKAYWRFFCYLNLFIFSMLVLILGDNLPVLFIGWEGVGLCSYLLIGFWYDKTANAAAGKKAFIANRIGDFGLICGMFLLVYYTGALDWDGIAQNAHNLITTNSAQQIHIWPIGGNGFRDLGFLKLSYLQPGKPFMITPATAVGLALFLGCTGKSAQLPLYTWLPDAMAGPTPVSALIHAATMVTAGIYLICRLSFVFVLSPAVMTIIAFTGATTALYAAILALVQNDIKRVLAYSTVSQLGFMFLGVGVGAFTAGFFHVFTHAFFKACLFLGAGSVIHAMHARIHDDDKSQDMRHMGGLRKYMPLTYGTFLASTLAIIGFPLTSGFFSKDEILGHALFNQTVHPYAEMFKKEAPWQAPQWAAWLLWGMGVAAATLTAFYMCRCLFMTFFGDFRGWTLGRPSQLSRSGAHKVDAHDDDDDDDHHHHEEDLSTPGYPPHESPRAMTIPLLILATAAIVAGVFNPSALKLLSAKFDFLPMDHWLEPVFEAGLKGVKPLEEHAVHSREWLSMAGAFGAFAVGTYIAYWMYLVNKGKAEKAYMLQARTVAGACTGFLLVLLGALILLLPGDPITSRALIFPGLLILLGFAVVWRVREIGLDYAYDKVVVGSVDALADTAASFDQGVVDFIIARLTALVVAATGTILRVFQNGVVHVYATMMVVGMAFFGWFFIVPHADISMSEKDGDYVLTAGPGLGYSYRWYPDASKDEPQMKVFTPTDQLKIRPEEGKSQTVKLEVRNAFGRVTSTQYTVTKPKVEKPEKLGALMEGQ